MARLSEKKLQELRTKGIRAYQKYIDATHTGSKRSQSYWRNRIFEYEEQLRISANRRIESVRKNKIPDSFISKTLDYIQGQRAERLFQDKPYFEKDKYHSPLSVTEAYESLLSESELLSKRYIRSKDAFADFVHEKIIPNVNLQTYFDSTADPTKKLTKEEREQLEAKMVEFWKWRQLNPVHEMFRVYPPSPPELKHSVGTMMVDLWNSEKIEKDMLNRYFQHFQDYLEAEKEGRDAGWSRSELIKQLDDLYWDKLGKVRYDKH